MEWLGYIKIPASGLASWEDDQYNTGSTSIWWASISRKPSSHSTVFIGYHNNSDPFTDSPKLQKLTNFVLSPTPGVEWTRYGKSRVHASPPAASDRGSMIVDAGSILSPFRAVLEIDWNTDPPTEEVLYTEGGFGLVSMDNVVNFTSKYWSLYAVSDIDYKTEGVGAGNWLAYTGPANNANSGAKRAAASFIDKGMFYYGATTGVAKITSYGQGAERVTLPYPSGYSLGSLTVNTNQRNTTDYICAVLQKQTSLTGSEVKLYYSVDQAETWVQGPEFSIQDGEFTAWFVKGHA